MNSKLSTPSQPARLQIHAYCPRAHTKHVAPGARAGEGLGCGKQWVRVRTTRPDQGQQPSKKEGAGSTQFLPLSAREQRKGRKARYGHAVYSLDTSSFKSNDSPISEERRQVCGLWCRLALPTHFIHSPASRGWLLRQWRPSTWAQEQGR